MFLPYPPNHLFFLLKSAPLSHGKTVPLQFCSLNFPLARGGAFYLHPPIHFFSTKPTPSGAERRYLIDRHRPQNVQPKPPGQSPFLVVEPRNSPDSASFHFLSSGNSCPKPGSFLDHPLTPVPRTFSFHSTAILPTSSSVGNNQKADIPGRQSHSHSNSDSISLSFHQEFIHDYNTSNTRDSGHGGL